MEITDVRATLQDKERLKGFANVTFDNAFVIRGMKIIHSNSGYFVAMPSRKCLNSTYQDVAHPVNRSMRRLIEEKVLQAYEEELEAHSKL